MESPDDIHYLKQFVNQHPDNQMGWYLLGKQYLLAGKEAKANYCFIQAGEIYDAFEHESHPLAEHQAQLQILKDWSERQKKKRRIRKAVLLAALLLAIVTSLPAAREIANEEAPPPVADVQPTAPRVGVIYIPQKETQEVGYAWNGLLGTGGSAPELTIAAKLEEEMGWRSWTGGTRIVMDVDRASRDEGKEKEASLGTRNQMEVTMYDSAACNCIPAEASGVYKKYRDWQREQELHWTLGSAITHYKKLFGKWPEKLDDMIKPYPNNVLAGEKEGMRGAFSGLLNKLKAKDSADRRASGKDSSANGAQTAAGSQAAAIGSNGLIDSEWNKPLEIIVDKSTHRLAVVQGSIVVRSYKVGLGADRTPEGTFYISEKVKNPNGSDNGTFGSRGMTLSNTLYAIHGTDEPDSIGKDESLGCIRMGKADVEELYDLVPLGTVVNVKNGTLPSEGRAPAERFRLEPKQDETNPVKVYEWLK